MTEMICIVCPKGCRLSVAEDSFRVTGNACARGEAYGRDELRNPMRTVTSTVVVVGGFYRRCPVKTAGAIAKSKIRAVIQALDAVRLTAPIQAGQVVVADVCGTGVDIIATRTINSNCGL